MEIYLYFTKDFPFWLSKHRIFQIQVGLQNPETPSSTYFHKVKRHILVLL